MVRDGLELTVLLLQPSEQLELSVCHCTQLDIMTLREIKHGESLITAASGYKVGSWAHVRPALEGNGTEHLCNIIRKGSCFYSGSFGNPLESCIHFLD